MTNTMMAKGLVYTAALISFVLAVYLWFGPSKEQGSFVGMWVPSILSLGALMFAGRKES